MTGAYVNAKSAMVLPKNAIADKEQICRLCLNVPSGRFQIINFSEGVMLEYVRLVLDMSVTVSPIICFQCLETLQQSYKFMMVCRKTENFLNGVHKAKKQKRLNLKHLLLSNNEDKNKGESEGFCRFCLAYLKTDSLVGLENLNEDIFLKDMIHKCLPESDLKITQQPAMCLECNEKLQTLFNFMMACQDNDEKIKKMMSVNGVDSKGLVRLSDVLKFVDDMNNGDVKPLEEENIMSIVKVETIEVEAVDIRDTVLKIEVLDNEIGDEFEETKKGISSHEIVSIKVEKDDIRDSVPKVEVLDNKMGEEFEETKKGISSPEILSIEEAMRQFEEIKGDESNHEVPSKVKAKRQLVVTKEDVSSVEIPSKAKAKRVRLIKTAECVKAPNVTTTHCCHHCNLTVHHPTDLVDHLLDVHQETRRLHKCQHCDFTTVYHVDFLVHKSLSRHLYKCEECGFTARRERQWLAHRRTHNDSPSAQRSLKCKFCSKAFHRQMLLDGHILTNHPEQESLVVNKVWRCEICQFKTLYGLVWRKHKCDQRYHCEHCEFATGFAVCLEKHNDIMHKYKCEVCQVNFVLEADLKTHMGGHSFAEEYEVLINC